MADVHRLRTPIVRGRNAAALGVALPGTRLSRRNKVPKFRADFQAMGGV
ncbi:hypothetical protein PLANPX_3536 [Lacipirellula parvula]|uniref:Uncharacterized protein n=1 Tax=Lacipirellula parvula TaxID=2650471 RepID=A0A5K7XB01_9BACT|nr:hypothetical protein PLANPX_3536 [Lacipirellula parvula]